MSAAVAWSPLLPVVYAALAAGLALAVVYRLRARGVFLLTLAALLLGPQIVRETREALQGRLVIVVDDSPSVELGQRSIAAAQALETLKKTPGVEPVVIRAGRDAESLRKQNTSLFAALAEAPQERVAGIVFITDGQVHDVPEKLDIDAPVSAVLVGKKDALDHRVAITSAPKYGMLGQEVTIRYRIDDGAEQSKTFTLDHPGQNAFEFSTPVEAGELTAANNRAAAVVGAVRDRLRVLLVSGRPHMGERAWRDLLKSDPAVDLVHFTILRPPTAFDATPAKEMALIAFPVEELFEKKIKDFDLIIFDKYAQYGLLEPRYFENMAAYVKNGGAFLVALDSERPEQTLFSTALGPLLPVTLKAPEESVLTEPFAPQLTAAGKAHPATAELDGLHLGKWQAQIDLDAAQSGQVLMTGARGRPLLILGQAGEGRVGVLASDNIWMWAKNIDGGGPSTELLRRVAHWLMKEPELEEDFIRAEARGGSIAVETRKAGPVTLTRPDGKTETLTPAALGAANQNSGRNAPGAGKKGWFGATVTADMNGLYRFENGAKSAYVAVGAGTGEEFSDVRTTDAKLKPLVEKTGGDIIWYDGHQDLHVKVKENKAYRVARASRAPALPNWAFLLIVLGGLLAVWKSEAGRRGKV